MENGIKSQVGKKPMRLVLFRLLFCKNGLNCREPYVYQWKGIAERRLRVKRIQRIR